MKKILVVMLSFVLAINIFACTTTTTQEVAENVSEETTLSEEELYEQEQQELEDMMELEILIEEDSDMLNTYSLLAVNSSAPFVDVNGASVTDVALNTAGADALINFMLTEGKELASNFGFDEYGEYLFYELDDAPAGNSEIKEATEETKLVRLSTTTSVNDSGLLEEVLKVFEDKYGYDVEVYSAGTGKAIANAKSGNADLILVHSKSQEENFVNDGFARVVEGQNTERLSFIYNYFVLCGPKSDPALVKDSLTVKAAFKKIADGKFLFLSRGDNSGTHTKEISLWPKELGITTEAESFAQYTDWYISSNAGMGTCLMQANERGAYILSDKATFLTFKSNN